LFTLATFYVTVMGVIQARRVGRSIHSVRQFTAAVFQPGFAGQLNVPMIMTGMHSEAVQTAAAIRKCLYLIATSVGIHAWIAIAYFMMNSLTKAYTAIRGEQGFSISGLTFLTKAMHGVSLFVSRVLGVPFWTVRREVVEIWEAAMGFACAIKLVKEVHETGFRAVVSKVMADDQKHQMQNPEKTPDEVKNDILTENNAKWLREIAVIKSCYHESAPFKICHPSVYPFTYKFLDFDPTACEEFYLNKSGTLHEWNEEKLWQWAKEDIILIFVVPEYRDGRFAYATPRHVKPQHISLWLKELRHYAKPVPGDGEPMATIKWLPYPTFLVASDADVKSSIEQATRGNLGYSKWSAKITSGWKSIERYCGDRPWLPYAMLFGIAGVYTVYSIWAKMKERRQVRFDEDEQAEEVEDDLHPQESPVLKNPDDWQHPRNKHKSNPAVARRRDKRSKVVQSAENPQEMFFANSREALLKCRDQIFVKCKKNVCLVHLADWSCVPDPKKHSKDYCCSPTKDDLKSFASEVSDYKSYFDNPQRRICVCGRCNGDTQMRKRYSNYRSSKYRLGYKPQGTDIAEFKGDKAKSLVAGTFASDDYYIVRPFDELTCQASSDFNNLSLASNICTALFALIVKYEVPTSNPAIFTEDSARLVHGVRTSFGYQTVRHLFGVHDTVSITSMTILYFDRNDRRVKHVKVDSKEALLPLTEHYNQCASSHSEYFNTNDIWCISHEMWTKVLLPHFPYETKDNQKLYYQLDTMSLYSNQVFEDMSGLYPKFATTLHGKYELEFVPFIIDCVEKQPTLDGKYVLHNLHYWSNTVGGDSGCPISIGNVVIAQHTHGSNSGDGKSRGRLMTSSCKQLLKIQSDSRLINSC